MGYGRAFYQASERHPCKAVESTYIAPARRVAFHASERRSPTRRVSITVDNFDRRIEACRAEGKLFRRATENSRYPADYKSALPGPRLHASRAFEPRTIICTMSCVS